MQQFYTFALFLSGCRNPSAFSRYLCVFLTIAMNVWEGQKKVNKFVSRVPELVQFGDFVFANHCETLAPLSTTNNFKHPVISRRQDCVNLSISDWPQISVLW